MTTLTLSRSAPLGYLLTADDSRDVLVQGDKAAPAVGPFAEAEAVSYMNAFRDGECRWYMKRLDAPTQALNRRPKRQKGTP